MEQLNRRRILKSGGVGLTMGLAGCTGGNGDDQTDGQDGESTPNTPGSTDASEDTYEWDIATIFPEGGTYYVHATEFARHINELSSGRFEVNVAGGGQYGTEPEQLQSLKSGAIEMVSQSACLPEAVFIDPTYIICATFFHLDQPSWESYMKFRKRSLQELEIPSKLHDAGVHLIGPDDEPQQSHTYGMSRGVVAKKAIRSPEDAQGYSAGVAQASIIAAPLEGIGFDVQTGAPGEAVSALQQGTYDARETSIDQAVSTGQIDPTSHYMDWRHGMNASYLQINTELYESLSDEDQDLLLEAHMKARESAGEINRQNEEDYLDQMRDEGLTVVTDFDRDALYNAARDGLRSWFDENDPPITYDTAIEWASLS
jgi:TRAP-type C4-dicarboxylate transport system substrate-binding protein